jgi:hypothetical protein
MSGWGLASSFDRYAPSIWGLVAYTTPPAVSSNTFAPVSGDALAFYTPAPGPVTLTNAWVNITAGGTTLTAGQNLVGVANLAGSLLAVTGDQTAAWAGTGNMPAAPLVGGPIIVPGPFWSLLLSVGTAPPTFRSGAPTPGVDLGPSIGSGSIAVPYQRTATLATALASFNPVLSGVGRNSIMIGWS